MKKIIFVILIIVVFAASACTTPVAVPQESDPELPSQEPTAAPTEAQTPAPTKAPTEKPTLQQQPNTIVIVVAKADYQEREFNPVFDALTAAGYDVIIASDEMGTATGGSETVQVDATFDELNGQDILGIVVIGGGGVRNLWENTQLHRVINEVDALNRTVAAICLAPLTLANAGAISSGENACWYNSSDIDAGMNALGVVDSSNPVTVFENVITGNGPDAAPAFAVEVVNALEMLK
ncbi:MAG: hypothetical protein HN948_00650 [Clostridia bacterium]|nr:hypothetical protein [Clostridia bacterium]MBT7121497.1 hypothetical protein [Clostridia bacterium]